MRGELQHGTRYAFQLGCPCGPCREANREYDRSLRARLGETYRAKAREYMRAYRQRNRERVRAIERRSALRRAERAAAA